MRYKKCLTSQRKLRIKKVRTEQKEAGKRNEIFKQFYFVPILFQVQIGITYTPDPNQRVR